MRIAERIAALLGNDGTVYMTRDGESLDTIARRMVVDVTTADQDGIAAPGGPLPDALRYRFSDGSAIVDLGNGWDIEGSVPWTWASMEVRAMNSLNSILVEGCLTQDPVGAATPHGTAVCNFTIASDRFYRGEDSMQKKEGFCDVEVSYFDIEVFSRLAERCAEELTEGRSVRVVGRLKQDRWQEKDGLPRSRVKIVAEHVEFKRAVPTPEEPKELQEA